MDQIVRHSMIDLAGALRHFRERDWQGCCTDETGRILSPLEVQQHFSVELGKGRKVIPFGNCPGFDFSGPGCPGHLDQEVFPC